MKQEVAEYLEHVQKIDSQIALQSYTEQCLSKLGFGIFAYIGFPPAQAPIGVNNHPKSWLEHYHKERYLNVDPVISKARNEIVPFAWTQIDNTLTPRERLVLAEGREVGIRCGATIPAHGPNQQEGMFFVSCDLKEKEFYRIWDEYKYDLHLIGIYFHEAFRKNVKEFSATEVYRLSDREKECLLWAFENKSASVTAEILGISPRTVETHLSRAMTKLGAYSKQQAVVKALLNGLITPVAY